jgi:hypothetical protein
MAAKRSLKAYATDSLLPFKLKPRPAWAAFARMKEYVPDISICGNLPEALWVRAVPMKVQESATIVTNSLTDRPHSIVHLFWFVTM